MSDLDIACIEIIVSKDRTAHRADHNGPVLNPEVINCFGNKLMQNPMPAARAVMSGCRGCPSFTGIFRVEGFWSSYNFFAVNNFCSHFHTSPATFRILSII